MKKQTFRILCAALCTMLCMMLCVPALAQSVEPSETPAAQPTAEATAQPTQAPQPVELAILLDGEPVKNVVMNLSETDRLQFSATEPVTWKSSKTYRGKVDQNGLLTCVSAGTLTLTATTEDGRRVSCEVKMTKLVTDIAISGSTEVAAGKKISLKAAVSPSNAANTKVNWSSSDTSVATVSSSGNVTAKKISDTRSVVIRAEAKDGSGVYAEHIVTVRPGAEKVSISCGGEEVKKVYLDIDNAPSAQLCASVLPADAGQGVTWKSDSSRVKVDANGVITGLRTGNATVTATAADGSGKKTTVKVYVVRMVTDIVIDGKTALTGGKSTTLSAKVLPSNASEKDIVWRSSDESAATVSKYGKVTAKKLNEVREAVITAEATDGSGVIARHIITITPPIESMSITAGGESVKTLAVDIEEPTVDLGVLIAPAAACQDVKWTSSSSARASVDENGIVTAKKTGSATITATAQDGSGKKATVKLNIVRMVKEIGISGDSVLTSGKSGKLRADVQPSNATNDDVTWSSSDPDALSVNKYGSLKAGKVDKLTQVTVTATAKDGSGVTAEYVVEVVPAAKSVAVMMNGEKVTSLTVDLNTCTSIDLDALIDPADASQQVKWSSDSSRAKVNAEGVVTFSRTGTVKISVSARDGSGKKASVKIRIIRAVQEITVSGDAIVTGGEEGKLKVKVLPDNATDDDVTWSSSDPEVLSVNKYGSIEAAKVSEPTQVIVTAAAKDGSGVVGSMVVTVMPCAQRVVIMDGGKQVTNVGIDLAGTKKLQLSALIEPANAAQDVKWTVSNKKYATVDENGLVSGLRAGTVTVTATAKDGSGVRASVTVNVGIMVKKLTVIGANQVSGGRSIDLDTTAYPSDATKKSVTWSSSDPELAWVDKDGEVETAVVDAPVQVTITATAKDGGGASAEHILTIVPAVRSISISRADANMAGSLILDVNGGTAQLQASAYPAMANQNVKWRIADDDVAIIDENGFVTAVGKGCTTITATAVDGTGVKAVLRIGVGDLSTIPYYFEIDRANQVVRVYERGADNTYSTLIKRMICSTGRNSTPGLDNGLYSMHGGRMVWMDGVAIYATRIKGHYLFHSVLYDEPSMNKLDTSTYEKLGSKASHGCIRLLAGDAKWIYDNAPKGCFALMMDGVRDINEYGAVSKPPLVSGKWDPTNPHPNNPDFDPTYTSDVKK